jgi:hypothetical protein
MRASRFPLHLPLRYRSLGDDQWRVGTTENISYSGVLFRVSDALQIGAQVELRLGLPGAPAASTTAEVSCLGRVVRTAVSADDRSVDLAVAIDDYDFVRPATEH